jgi:ribose/xylose/arabinose/galactoside ABC-type transport system permease subunit
MNMLSVRLKEFRSAAGRRIHPREEPAISQNNLIFSSVVSGTVGNFIGGNFFTGILLLLQASDGIMGFVAMTGFVGNLLQVLSPLLLERFQSRKKLLIYSRMVIYIFNIVVIGLVPFLPYANGTKLVVIIAVLLLINLINAMSAPGFAVWQIKCVPDDARVNFFTLNSIINGVVIYSLILGAGTVVDHYKSIGREMDGLLLFRGIALVLAGNTSVGNMPAAFKYLGRAEIMGIPASIVYMCIIIIIGGFLLNKVNFFNQAYFIGSNKESAKLAGIDVEKFIYVSYAITGAVAAFAGMTLASRLGSANQNAGAGLEFRNVVALLVGGVSFDGGEGNILGVVVGVLFMQIVNNALVLLNINPNYTQIIIGFILIISVALDQANKSRKLKL